MRKRGPIALTGPAAAALLGLDGFRDKGWPPLWCAPRGSRDGDSVILTRRWSEPTEIAGVQVAPVGLVLRHLGLVPLADGHLTPLELVELALEHALREQMVELEEIAHPGGAGAGDRLLKSAVRQRGSEPPTESYAETRALQRLRSIGIEPWRQVRIVCGRKVHRADFLLTTGRLRRTEAITPGMGCCWRSTVVNSTNTASKRITVAKRLTTMRAFAG